MIRLSSLFKAFNAEFEKQKIKKGVGLYVRISSLFYYIIRGLSSN